MRKDIITMYLLVSGICFLLVGVMLGQHRDVLTKAVRICMECIGIG